MHFFRKNFSLKKWPTELESCPKTSPREIATPKIQGATMESHTPMTFHFLTYNFGLTLLKAQLTFLVSTERRKRRDSAGESNKAESKQPRQNCHIFGTGKTYLVQEQLAEAGEERGKCPRK